ncbi:hypothetical protein ABMX69_06805 [Vibrio vulnificus]|uniref:hypothetical protein n=1 Tax=Vibrio vulnificus TaxID=672 RepID=UPI001DD029FD|nr:hypothetical protein [Vibrio vulnificus]EHZ2765062.1 hypothetical protein [Vibrio vulnificus]
MIFTTLDAEFYHLEDVEWSIVFVTCKSDTELNKALVENTKAVSISEEKAGELIRKGCVFQFAKGCLIQLGELL